MSQRGIKGKINLFYIETFQKVPLYLISYIVSFNSLLLENIILSVLSNKETDPICPKEKDIFFPEVKPFIQLEVVGDGVCYLLRWEMSQNKLSCTAFIFFKQDCCWVGDDLDLKLTAIEYPPPQYMITFRQILELFRTQFYHVK